MRTFNLTVSADDLGTMSDLDNHVQELMEHASSVVLVFDESQRKQVLEHLQQDAIHLPTRPDGSCDDSNEALTNPSNLIKARDSKHLPVWEGEGVELATDRNGNLSFKLRQE